MAKYKIDYHKQTGRYFIKYQGTICSAKSIGELMKNVRKEFGNGSYTLTSAARKNHG